MCTQFEMRAFIHSPKYWGALPKFENCIKWPRQCPLMANLWSDYQ